MTTTNGSEPGHGDVERSLEQAVARETAAHGQQWAAQYDGYFSNPAMAGSFLDAIEAAIAEKQPDALVDLGGGTGFILLELLRRGKLPERTKLYDMDLSAKQLEAIADPRIRPLHSSFLEFQRGAVAERSERLMLITRSTLHYAGILGQRPVLRHLRDQLEPGELLIQQTACFSTQEEALLTDELMERMRSDKWMPTLESLLRLCKEAGFDVTRIEDAPDLPMSETALANRYGIGPEEMADIRSALAQAYSNLPRLQLTPTGFTVMLEYRILTCEAGSGMRR